MSALKFEIPIPVIDLSPGTIRTIVKINLVAIVGNECAEPSDKITAVHLLWEMGAMDGEEKPAS